MSAEAGVSSLVLFKFGACESILPNGKFRILEIVVSYLQ
jgi:hypothetical protein